MRARRRLLAPLVVVVVAVAAHAPSAAARACPGAQEAPATGPRAASAVACLVNAERTARGERALHVDTRLARAARGLASAMVRDGFFAHVTPHGSTPLRRVAPAGYARRIAVGEVIGAGTGAAATPSAMVAQWLASPPHRSILLDRSYRDLGVGVSAGAPLAAPSVVAAATYALDLGAASG